MNTRQTAAALLLGMLWAGAQASTVLVNDQFTDTDRIGGFDGSSTLAGDPLINAPTSTNTQWVVNGTSSMVAAGSVVPEVHSMYWTMNNISNRMGIGYFPGVTIGAAPVTFTLKFTTGTSGTDDDNLRMALVDSRANDVVKSDGFSSTDPAYVGDVGYAFNSASSNVGGGSAIDLVMRTAERVVTTSNNLLGTASDWGADGVGNTYLVASSGSTGYFQPGTDYTIAVTMSYDGSALTVTGSITGGNFVGLTWTVVDGSPSSIYYDCFAIRWGKGSLQFSGFNFTEFTVIEGDIPVEAPILVTELVGGDVQITCPSVVGNNYQLQGGAGNLGTWPDIGDPVAGTGADLIFTQAAPAAGNRNFYRVVVSAAP